MKRIFYFAIFLSVLSMRPVSAQPSQPPPAGSTMPPRLPDFQERIRQLSRQVTHPDGSSDLTRFNLDFPGGTPTELVAAIQKATGKPLNVIIPPEFADTKLPPLKMNDVNVQQLFQALEAASYKTESYVTGSGPYFGAPQNYQQRTTGYGFKTDGPITDNSIWYFRVEKAPEPPAQPRQKSSRFYALAPYLDHGLKVDDITTAVETAWKMAGETSPPEISFHKDTKLLIAVGDPEKLQTIDSVLQALGPELHKPSLVLPARKKPDESKPGE